MLMPLESLNKMISFRLSDEEYERLRELCFNSGGRSVSEMARVAVRMLLEKPQRAPQETIESRLAGLEGRLQMLSLEIRRLDQHAMVKNA